MHHIMCNIDYVKCASMEDAGTRCMCVQGATNFCNTFPDNVSENLFRQTQEKDPDFASQKLSTGLDPSVALLADLLLYFFPLG